MLHAEDHGDLPHPVLDLGCPVGNEAVLAVKGLCARIRVGHPQRRRLVRIDDRIQQQAPMSAGPAARLGFVRLHAGLTILVKLAAVLAIEVAVWRCVQQTNPGRAPLDEFRVALSGLASLVWLLGVHAGPPIHRDFRGQVALSQLRHEVSVPTTYACGSRSATRFAGPSE